MSEKEKEEIALILQNNTAWCQQAGCYIIHGAIEKIIAKIDQEKRSTAIAFSGWIEDHNWRMNIADKWYSRALQLECTLPELYDLYFQSLPK